MTDIQNMIKELLINADEIPYDWQNMTLREILSEFDRIPGNVVFWGMFTEVELDTVFMKG